MTGWLRVSGIESSEATAKITALSSGYSQSRKHRLKGIIYQVAKYQTPASGAGGAGGCVLNYGPSTTAWSTAVVGMMSSVSNEIRIQDSDGIIDARCIKAYFASTAGAAPGCITMWGGYAEG